MEISVEFFRKCSRKSIVILSSLSSLCKSSKYNTAEGSKYYANNRCTINKSDIVDELRVPVLQRSNDLSLYSFLPSGKLKFGSPLKVFTMDIRNNRPRKYTYRAYQDRCSDVVLHTIGIALTRTTSR